MFTNEQSAIFVAKPLDAETKSSYDLEITASDGFNTATDIVSIAIVEENLCKNINNHLFGVSVYMMFRYPGYYVLIP